MTMRGKNTQTSLPSPLLVQNTRFQISLFPGPRKIHFAAKHVFKRQSLINCTTIHFSYTCAVNFNQTYGAQINNEQLHNKQ
jgi:hypothetical protein